MILVDNVKIPSKMDEGVECLSKLSEDVDNELNKIYNQLMKSSLKKIKRYWLNMKEIGSNRKKNLFRKLKKI